MAPPILVDPEIYYMCARELLTEYGTIDNAVAQVLVPQLADTYGMGGNDHVAGNWNSEYRRVADHMIATLVSYGNALLTFSDMLNLAGYNWAVANYDADRNPNRGPQPAMPPPRVGQKMDAARVGIPDAQPAPYTTHDRGLTAQPAALADQLITELRQNNTQIPEGDTAALGRAAAAWQAFADHNACSGGGSRLQNLIGTFGPVRTPEAPDILDDLTILRDGANAVGAAAKGFATAVRGFETGLADFRSCLSGTVPGAFSDAAAAASIHDAAVLIACSGEVSTESVRTGAATLAGAVSGHDLYAVTAQPHFPDTDALPTIQAKLEEIAQSPIDELANRATWNSGPVRCTPKPEGQQDFGDADDRVKAWMQDAVEYGNKTGVDPRLVLTVLYNEGALRSDSWIEETISDPYDAFRQLANAPRKLVDDGVGTSLGLANMKEDTFNKLKEIYPEEFAGVSWQQIATDDSLAIKALAFNLARLEPASAEDVDDNIVERYSHNEYLALSYNAEKFLEEYNEMGKVGPAGQNYINMTNERWKIAEDLLDGAYKCC
ncbi:hypothetical protein IU448_23510 [Nocardia flavorosea]|uniref:hypothetical protein n=1 Tax=Nocardia flavorosea TaxID=53429 RepID=UPI0018951366|nr:hypothetical protein [Nocardia flavorosea]MBF6351960.1 hypothetical protein [Nocardia flavorosea]